MCYQHGFDKKDNNFFLLVYNLLQLNTLKLILKFFHFVDNSKLTTSVDPCAKFQPLCDHANRLFRHFYIPYQQLSIDESLVGTKSHTSLMQYLPKKQHHRWGIKLWVFCDSITNYCLGCYVYKVAKCGDEERGIIKESGLSYLVVTKLMAVGNYLNKGYHLFVDNFFPQYL